MTGGAAITVGLPLGPESGCPFAWTSWRGAAGVPLVPVSSSGGAFAVPLGAPSGFWCWSRSTGVGSEGRWWRGASGFPSEARSWGPGFEPPGSASRSFVSALGLVSGRSWPSTSLTGALRCLGPVKGRSFGPRSWGFLPLGSASRSLAIGPVRRSSSPFALSRRTSFGGEVNGPVAPLRARSALSAAPLSSGCPLDPGVTLSRTAVLHDSLRVLAQLL